MKRKKLNATTGATDGSNLQALAPKSVDTGPQMISTASDSTDTSTRRNIAGSIERTSRFANIEEGLVPFRYSSSIYGANRSSIDVRDAVVLCQKCYYNFAIFRNIIDLMTEFSCSQINLKGGSEKSRNFFNAWMKRINMYDFQDKFYREYYRSGNVFIYRFDADIKPNEMKELSQTFAETLDETYAKISPKSSEYVAPNLVNIRPDKLVIEKMRIPARYILLNPADIQMMSTLNFAYGIYFKILTDYEIAQIRNPRTEQDIAVFKDLPKEVQEQIKTGSRVIAIPLDPQKVSMVFYKKQDYEPFAVPMGYPVLEDINFKAELRKIDMAIARTMQQIVLVVTTGNEPTKGGINPKNIDALRKLFTNQSVGRVLIADYTTKAEFVVPAIADLLDPRQYEVVNQDINIGLNNVFAGSDKFANQQQKVELFISRLEQGRRAFLNNFLIPEMQRVAKSLNFKNYPEPELEDIQLKDNSSMKKIYSRLMEIGVLTPEQGFKALQSGILPDPSLMHEEQQDYKKKRDAGLYTPLIGGPKDPGGEEGRPNGSKAPQTTKKISPIGTKASEEQPREKYSAMRIKDNMILAQAVEKEVTSQLKIIHNIKKMSALQKEVAADIVTTIMSNEEPSKWLSNAKVYCEKPEDKNNERVLEVNKIATAHQIDNYLASLLLASRIENA